MLTTGIRSTAAHDKKHHPLQMAHSPTYAAGGQTLYIYVICGWLGCAQRLQVDAAVWREEEARRRAATDLLEARRSPASTRAGPA